MLTARTATTSSQQRSLGLEVVSTLIHLKQWVAMLNGELSQDSNSSKTDTMHSHTVTKNGGKAFKLFHPFVDSLMPEPCLCLHAVNSIILSTDHTLWHFGLEKILSNAAIISFDSLTSFKHVLDSKPEHVDVRPITTRKRSCHPNNVTSKDANTNLMPQTWLHAKLVASPRLGVPLLTLCGHLCRREGNIPNPARAYLLFLAH